MDRTGALAVALIAVVAVGVGAAWLWPSTKPALDCPPDQVRFVDAGEDFGVIARCAPPGAPAEPEATTPPMQKLAVGARLDLNHIREADLAQIPGVGPALAHTLIEERDKRGGFKSWDEVDAVKGVGPARLEVLQQALELR
ncbi:MAG: helix-hairpin-helix domain-containing protein [Myxococcaceae bacterium]|nr:helix-hairpin-helix domain-containing protein [Myxococcaceae bacterium]